MSVPISLRGALGLAVSIALAAPCLSDFTKRFQETGVTFDHVQMFIATPGKAFAMPVGVNEFTPFGWAQSKNTGTLLLADGQPLLTSEFTVHFAGPSTPLEFYLQAWNGNVLVEEKTARFDGTVWTVFAGAPWADVRIDATLVQLTPGVLCRRVGEPFVVDVTLRHAEVPIVGGQFFLQYDQSKLDLISVAPGDAPFTLEVFRHIDELHGAVDYAVGVPGGMPGTLNDTVMARLTFTALMPVCNSADMVIFRPHDPLSCLSNDVGGQIDPALITLPPMAFDDFTVPQIVNLPANIVVNVDPPNTCEKVVTWTAPTAIDNCGYVAIHQSAGPPSGSTFLGQTTTTIEYRAVDPCGNVALASFTVRVIDNIPPLLVPPANLTLECTAPTDVSATGMATASDNCDPTPAVTFTDAVIPGACPAARTIHRQWRAEDAAGNVTLLTQILTIEDKTPPAITPPDPIFTHGDAGRAMATVNLLEPFAQDNCDTLVTITAMRNDGLPTSAPYPMGVTTVVWRAEDDCGNYCTCTQLVVVDDYNVIEVDLDLSPTVVPIPLTRCITFELFSAPNPLPVYTTAVAVPFINGQVRGFELQVPTGVYTCMSARDKLHSLRRTDTAFNTRGAHYASAFTGDPLAGGNWLTLGNLNDDRWIDILDFGVFAWQWGRNYGTGNTTCDTLYPHADLSGNGLVWTEDFTFIQIYFLQGRDVPCGGAPLTGDGPRTRVSRAELAQLGLSQLAAGDLNRDGWLDSADIAAFLSGKRPTARLPLLVVPRELIPDEVIPIELEP